MSKRVLWLDNDAPYLEPYVEALADSGYDATVVTTLSEAEARIKNNQYSLLILDVMIPTKSEEEELNYPPHETDHGHKAGLFFFKRLKSELEYAGTQVLVLTVRLDQRILDEFVEAGLPPLHFDTKYKLREVNVFLDRINLILGGVD